MERYVQLIDAQRWDELRHEVPSDGCNIMLLNTACRRSYVPKEIISLIVRSAGVKQFFPKVGEKPINIPTPLHVACASGSAGAVSVLLDALSESAGAEVQRINHEGLNAFDAAWLKFLSPEISIEGERPLSKYQTNNHLKTLCEMKTFEDLRYSTPVMQLWNKTTMLLLSADRGQDPLSDGRQWQVVHVIAANGSQLPRNCIHTLCPSVVMWMALKLYPDQVRQRDEYGDLPLHKAVRHPSSHVLDLEKFYLGSKMQTFACDASRTVVEMLFRAYPGACKVQDRSGRLPLNIAIESYTEWTMVYFSRTIQPNRPNIPFMKLDKDAWENAILLLAEEAPEALNTRDIKTHLYPFMLAATPLDAPLNVIYRLLRANPNAVEGGIRPTHHEQYLEAQNRSLKRERDNLLSELSQLKSKVARYEGRLVTPKKC